MAGKKGMEFGLDEAEGGSEYGSKKGRENELMRAPDVQS
jgi:hypothetical protein